MNEDQKAVTISLLYRLLAGAGEARTFPVLLDVRGKHFWLDSS